MSDNRLSSPVVSALSIQEQYHKDVEAKLTAYGISEDKSKAITTDIFTKDDIYFSLNRSYERINETFTTFRKSRELHSDIPDMFLDIDDPRKHMYTHQKEAIDSILAEKTTIISTGTGSGKTESFLIPILHYCLVQKSQQKTGIKAIILYPLNALANDQISRILEAVKGKGIRVGCFIGSTPKTKERKKDEQAEICISRREMIDQPPDILITNYIMLDRLITKPQTRTMFKRSSEVLKYIVVDEIHYFRGTKGANLSLLLRRLHTFCQKPPVQIGASGTLRRGGGYFPDQTETQIEEFAKLLFGNEAIEKGGFQLIEPVFQIEEQDTICEILPVTTTITGNTFLEVLNREKAIALGEQLFGTALWEKYRQRYPREGGGIQEFSGYHLILHSPFIQRIQKQLTKGACSFNDFIQLFKQMYKEHYGNDPSNPKGIVEAYWSFIDYINEGCAGANLPLILDYRIHLILNDVSEALTRCLRCGHYHDGRCLRCRHCNNGLLFKVSKNYPDKCIAYMVNDEIFVNRVGGKQVFPVLVGFHALSEDVSTTSLLTLEDNPILAEEESYRVRPLMETAQYGTSIELTQQKQALEPLLISDAKVYWHNVLKIIDALVTHQETRISDKILGFIDDRERASGLKLRLNDDFADRALTTWATGIWKEYGKIDLFEAFTLLQNELTNVSSTDDDDEREHIFAKLFQEMAFWFSRMLTYLEDSTQFETWKISVDENLSLTQEEHELLENIFLPANAIDRTSFWTKNTANLQHFYLDKYRVEACYGVGMKSSKEKNYYIISLGEQGVLHHEFIERVGETNISNMLQGLAEKEILLPHITPDSLIYYQLHPRRVYIETIEQFQKDTSGEEWKSVFALVECHTADHKDERRTEIEKRFNEAIIQALICTPTLEMGVDIKNLSSVLMIGFPPSPANYAQRAGRAGRSKKTRQATIAVLSSSNDAHDEYYYALPTKMIEGEITPPQFTLKNYTLLLAHSYGYLLAGTEDRFLRTKIKNIERDIQTYVQNDDLHIANVIGQNAYNTFAQYLVNDSLSLLARLEGSKGLAPTLEDCYRHGIFPDYGFRNDGLTLLDRNTTVQKEDQDRFLTAREPEGASKKLVPGRIVFCGGKAVQIEEDQPTNSYELTKDPAGKYFRLPKFVVADPEKIIQIEKWRDPDKLYRVSRMLDIKQPLNTLKMQGPLYCQVYYVPESTLFIINEGEIQPDGQQPVQLKDKHGLYRFGTRVEREGLLIRFTNLILSPNMKANFLAVLLRSIPDGFNLDDAELRVVQNISIYPKDDAGEKHADFFIYGQDKSGLVPFQRIFEQLDTVLSKALQNLQSCTCKGAGCYLCLFSLNSPMLTGHISHESAIEFISAYLKEQRLKPYIVLSQQTINGTDLIIHIQAKGDQWVFTINDIHTNTKDRTTIESTNADRNSALYQHLSQLLKGKREAGAKCIEIRTNVDYVCKQLRGENDIKRGRAAFFTLWLERIQWSNWQVTMEKGM